MALSSPPASPSAPVGRHRVAARLITPTLRKPGGPEPELARSDRVKDVVALAASWVAPPIAFYGLAMGNVALNQREPLQGVAAQSFSWAVLALVVMVAAAMART